MARKSTHTSAWINFTYGSFALGAFMLAAGIFFLPVDLWTKGFLSMAALMTIQSSVSLTKTIRDIEDDKSSANL